MDSVPSEDSVGFACLLTTLVSDTGTQLPTPHPK